MGGSFGRFGKAFTVLANTLVSSYAQFMAHTLIARASSLLFVPSPEIHYQFVAGA